MSMEIYNVLDTGDVEVSGQCKQHSANSSTDQKSSDRQQVNGITRRDDGTLRPNFKPVKKEEDFSASSYATGVANELLWALTSLLGK